MYDVTNIDGAIFQANDAAFLDGVIDNPDGSFTEDGSTYGGAISDSWGPTPSGNIASIAIGAYDAAAAPGIITFSYTYQDGSTATDLGGQVIGWDSNGVLVEIIDGFTPIDQSAGTWSGTLDPNNLLWLSRQDISYDPTDNGGDGPSFPVAFVSSGTPQPSFENNTTQYDTSLLNGATLQADQIALLAGIAANPDGSYTESGNEYTGALSDTAPGTAPFSLTAYNPTAAPGIIEWTQNNQVGADSMIVGGSGETSYGEVVGWDANDILVDQIDNFATLDQSAGTWSGTLDPTNFYWLSTQDISEEANGGAGPTLPVTFADTAGSTQPAFVPELTIATPSGALAHIGEAAPIAGVSVADLNPDPAATVTVTLTAADGELTLTGYPDQPPGYAVTGATVSVTGSVDYVNTVLANLTDTVSGADTITVDATDSDGNVAAEEQIPVSTLPLPVITAPSQVAVSPTASSPVPGVVISEPGAPTDETFNVTLASAAGQLTLTGFPGEPPSYAMTGGTLAFSGDLSLVNTVLATLSDTATGPDTITIAATDSAGGTAISQQITVASEPSIATIETPLPITLPDSHVATDGVSDDTVSLAILNSGTASQTLSAYINSVLGQGYGNGAFSGLAAGATDDADIQVGVNNTTAGALQGSVIVGFALNGAAFNGENLVVNGGFENGTTGWVSDNPSEPSGNEGIFAHSGSYYLSLGAVNSDADTSQVLSTQSGVEYAISLWYYSSGNHPDDLNVSFGGTNILSLTDPPAAGWTEYTEDAVATGNSTTLTIGGYNSPAYDGVDDVSVVPITALGTALPFQVVQVQGNVYREASPVFTAPPTAYLHVGDDGGSLTESLQITNAVADDGFSENLDASVVGAFGSGSVQGLAPGASDDTDLTISLPTTAAGTITDTVTIAAVSDGTGIDSLGTTFLGDYTAPVSVVVNNYATAAIQETSLGNNFGGGLLTQVDNVYTLDLGLIAAGAGNVLTGLNLANTAIGPADTLDAVVSLSGDPAFLDTLTNSGTVSVTPGQSLTFDTVDVATGTAGIVTETLTLAEAATNPSGFFEVLPTQTVVVTGTVVPNTALANPVINNGPTFVLPAVHVGATDDTALSITNDTTADGTLVAAIGQLTGAATANGYIGALDPGATDDSSITVGINTATGGLRTGTVTLNFLSTGSFTSNIGTNLVLNGGFENGLTDWTSGNGADTSGSVGITAHTGNYFLALGAVGGDADTDQILPTQIGTEYQISLWYWSSGRYPSDLNVYFGSDQVLSLTDAPYTGGWVEYVEDAIATSASTELVIAGRNDPSWDGVDDVSVVAVGTSTVGSVALPQQSVTVQAPVYREASPSISGPNNLYLHVGDDGGRVQDTLTVTNNTPADGYSENLDAAVTGYSTGVITASGTITDLTPGATDQSSLGETIFTTQPGYFENYVYVHALSDGTGVDNLGTTDLGTIDVPVFAYILNYATAAFVQAGSVGTLRGSGTNYVFDLGDISLNSGTVVAELGVANTASIASDSLGGTITASGDPEILLTGETIFGGIGAGGTVSGLDLAVNTGTSGVFTETLTLTATGSNPGGFSEALPSETVTVIGTVELSTANPQVNTASPVNFGAVRAGTTLSQALSISNVAPAGADSLNVTATGSGNASATGAITGLAAGAPADNTDIVASLSDESPGFDQGTVTLSTYSQLTGGSLEPTTPPTTPIVLQATVYSEAQHAVSLGALPVLHTGDDGGSVSGEITVTNDAYSSYTEALIVTASGPTGSITVTPTVTGDISAFGDVTIPYTIPTDVSGTVTGTITLTFASDGTGTDGAPVTQIGTQVVTLAAAVFNYATAEIEAASGGGTLTGSGGAYTLNLGDVSQGDTPILEDLALFNAATPVSDLLSGSIVASGDPEIGFGGPYDFSGVGAQQGVDGIDLSLNSGTTGVFTATVTIVAVDSNPGGYIAPAETLTVQVTGTVMPQTGFEVLEPYPTVLHVGDPGTGAIGIVDTLPGDSGESLNATVLTAPGGVSIPSSIGPIAPGTTSDLDYVIDTSNPGTLYGDVGLSFATGGTGTAQALGTLEVPLVASIYNYATAHVLAQGFDVTSSGTATVINFGTLLQGGTAETAVLAILNSANGLADRLSGTLTPLTNTGFIISGSDAFSQLRAGYADYLQDVSLDPLTPGTITATFDLSNSGSDDSGYEGTLPDQTVTIIGTVIAAQPPQITAPATITVPQGIASGIALSVTDPSAYAGETFTVTASDTNGVLSATGSGVSGAGSTDLTITGSLTQVNDVLATLTDTNASTASDQIALSVSDAFGNTSTATVGVTVAPLSPQFVGPTLLTVQLGGASGPLGLTIQGVDEFGTTPITVTLTAQGGTLSDTTNTPGATITSEDDGHTLVITDSPAQIDNALGNVDYQPPGGDPPTSDSIGVSASSSSGVSLSGTVSVTINPPAPPPPPSGPPMSNALFAAILAMDSYNRGYGVGVGGLSNAPGTQLGTATVLEDDTDDQGDGFYAIAYSWNGQTVISYRGTDNLSILDSANDILNGWVQGAGILSSQAADAAAFYQTVTGTSVFQGRRSNTLLVGHSLGGGLAGYVAALTGNQAYAFDNMPYAESAVIAAVIANLDAGYYSMAGYLSGQSNAAPVPLPNASGVTAIYTSGEVLSLVRTLGPAAAAPFVASFMTGYFLGTGQFNPVSAAFDAGAVVGAGFKVGGEENDLPALSAYANNTLFGVATPATSVQLHSVALLVLLQYAQDNNLTQWQSVGANLFQAYYDDEVGSAIQPPDGGAAAPSAQMLDMIAYSAINQGTMPFGDTGIQALFHDADVLGQFGQATLTAALSNSNVFNDLADILVEYAGWLARNQDTDTDNANGVFTYDQNVLQVDLSDDSWAIDGQSTPFIVGTADLVTRLFPDADANDALPDNIYLGTNDASGASFDLSDDTGTDLIYAGDGSVSFTLGTGTTYFEAGGGTDQATVDQTGQELYYTGGMGSGSGDVDASGLPSYETISITDNGGAIQTAMGAQENLLLANPQQFSNYEGMISGFQIGNDIDLANTSVTQATWQNGALNAGSLQLQLTGADYSQDLFDTEPDGNGGTYIRIATMIITPNDPTFQAGAGPEQFTIQRMGDDSGSATVYISTEDPSDQNDGDFDPLSYVPVTFQAGSDTANFTLNIDGGDHSGQTKTFGLQATDTSDSSGTILATDEFSVTSPPPPPPPPGPPNGGGYGCPHFTTFDNLGFWFQGAGEFVAAESTVPGDNFQVQMRIEPEGAVDSSVSIITQIAVQVGADRVTFDPNRALDNGFGSANPVFTPGDSDVVWVNGAPVTIDAANPVFTLPGGTITMVSEDDYRVVLNTGEVVTINPYGDGMGLDVALAPNARPDSVEGFLGSYDGQANSFMLPDGTVLGPDLTQDQLYQTFANAWRVTDTTSLFDYAPGQDTETFTNTQYPRQVLTLSDFPADLVAEAAALVAAAGITDPSLAQAAEFDYITMGDPGFITEDAFVESETPAGLPPPTPATIAEPVAPPPSIGVMAEASSIVEATGATTSVSFDVTLTSPATTDTVVEWGVIAGTGLNTGRTYFTATDFDGILPSGTATVVAGSTLAVVTVAVPMDAVGSAVDKWLAISIDSPAGDPVYDPTAQTDIVNNTPIAGAPALPTLSLLGGTSTQPTEYQPALTQNGNDFTINLGQILRGAVVSPMGFAIANAATAPADGLTGTLTRSGGDGFFFYNTTLPGTIDAGSAYQSLQIEPDSTQIGANTETLTLTPYDVNQTGYSAALPDMTLTVQDTIIAPASPVLNTASLVFGNVRVGTTDSAPISVGNAAGQSEAPLDVTLSATGSAVVAGSVLSLAPGTTDAGDLSGGLDTSRAGALTGTITVSYFSDLGNGVSISALPSGTVAVTGSAYREAVAAAALTNPIVHVGQSASEALLISNAVAADGFSESLIAGLIGSSGAIDVTSGGPTGDIVAGGTNSSFSVSVDTAQAGIITGQVTLAVTSDGTGIDGLGTIAEAPQTLTVTGTVENYATAQVIDLTSGGPAVTQNGTVFEVNLGDVALGATAPTLTLGIKNAASGPADLLSGSFVAGSTGSAIALNGFTAFSGVAAGATQSGLTVALNTGTIGAFSQSVTLYGTGSDPAFSGTLTPITILVEGSVGVSTGPAVAALNTPGPFVLANQRVGRSPASSEALSFTNAATAPADGLDVSIGATTGSAVATGAISLLAAGHTDSSSVVVGLDNGTAGAVSGTVVLDEFTDGTGIDQNGISSIGTAIVAVSGAIYRTADAVVSAPADTVVHRGATGLLAIQAMNAAVSDGYSEDLIAAVAGASDGFTAGVSGPTADIAAGAADGSLNVGFSTANAGTITGDVTLDLTSDGGIGTSSIDGLGTVALPSQTIAATATVYNYATASAAAAVNLGNARVGNALTDILGVSNTAANDGYSEALDASLGNATGAATASGSFTGLQASATDTSDLLIGLNTGTVGVRTGSVTLASESDGNGIDGLGTTALASQTIDVTGTVYREAAAGIAAPAPFYAHVGNSGTLSFSVANTAAADGFSEQLVANVVGSNGLAAVQPGTTGDINAGGSASVFVVVNTGSAGVITGGVTLDLLSDGTGIDGLGSVDIGTQTIAVSGTIYNFATAAVTTGGVGTLTGSGSLYTLNLGTVALGSGLRTATLNLDNIATGVADGLSVASTISAVNGVFVNNGFGTLATVAAGHASSTMDVSMGSGTAGTFTEALTFVLSSTDGGGATSLTPITIDVTGSVAAPAGQVFVLTTGTDVVNGGATGSNVVLAGNATLSSGDQINAGSGGDNTLALQGGGVFNLTLPSSLTNIETITAQEGQPAAVINGVAYQSEVQTVDLRAGMNNVTVQVSPGTPNPNDPAASAITIAGAANNDVIQLGSGDDTVTLGQGETVDGGSGSDVILVTATTISGSVVTGGSGQTEMYFTGGGTEAMGSNISNVGSIYLASTTSGWNFTANSIANMVIQDASTATSTITAGGMNQTLTGGAAGKLTMVGDATAGSDTTFKDSAALFTGDTLRNFASGDLIDITGLGFVSQGTGAGQTSINLSGGKLAVLVGGVQQTSVALPGSFTLADFMLGSDGAGGTQIGYHMPPPI